MELPKINSPKTLCGVIQEIGFLPFFKNEIPGFSLEECVERRFWFPDKGEGVWEWKGPVVRMSGCAYGKFFRNKAGFISREWFPDFANFRRQGYDMDALYDDGYAKRVDLEVWNHLNERGSLLTGELKQLGNFRKDGNKGFDSIITRLQMACYVVISDFEYLKDKHGSAYGWGVARYETPEERFGEAFTSSVYQSAPEESGRKVLEHLRTLIPGEYEKEIRRMLQKGCVLPDKEGKIL